MNPYDYKHNTPLTEVMERTLLADWGDPIRILMRLEDEAARAIVEEGDAPVTPAKVKQRVTDALQVWK